MPERARCRGMTAPEIVLAFDFGLKRIGIASGDTLTRTRRTRGPRPSAARTGPDWAAIEPRGARAGARPAGGRRPV